MRARKRGRKGKERNRWIWMKRRMRDERDTGKRKRWMR